MSSIRPILHVVPLLIRTLALAGLLLQAAAVQAQTPPTITSDGTMGSTITQTGNAYNVNGGTINGSNLFHSFGLFNIPTGGSATFTGPSSIANILSRVTGGQRSTIDGLIHSKTDMPNANFYLINPSGVVFGSGARLEVGGSFHVSTADYLGFGVGEPKFSARPVPGELLSAAPPAAFGFLSPTPAPISVQGSTLRVDPGETLSLVGGDVQIAGTDPASLTLRADGGRIQIVSVGPPVPGQEGIVTLGPDVNLSSFTRLGQIDISKGARIDASGARGGTVSIRGGRLIVDSSSLLAFTTGSLDGAELGIDIKVEGDIVLRNQTSVATRSSGAGRAGDIEVEARNGSVSITGNTRVGSDSLFTGQSGNVTVKATDAVAISGTSTSIFSFSNLGAGEILVDGRSVSLLGGANIGVDRAGVQGGNVTVTARDSIVIAGGSDITGRAFSRDVGFVDISVPDGTVIMDNGFINTVTRTIGDGGNISVKARDVILIRGSRINSSSELSSTTGAGGNVTVTADSVSISGGSGLFSEAQGIGPGGNITVTAGEVQLTDGTISARSLRTGTAGNIDITATDRFVSKNSSITTEARQADGGDVNVRAGSLFYLHRSNVTTAVGTGSGAGGNINIDPQFVILDRSRIRADAFGGPGGNVRIVADVYLTSGSIVSASSALGVPGTIDIQANVTDVSGGLTQLPESTLQAASLLRAACTARLAGGPSSSLVVSGREGIPPEPGAFLSSSLIDETEPALSLFEEPNGELIFPRVSLWASPTPCSR